jgi:hypothetical protein
LDVNNSAKAVNISKGLFTVSIKKPSAVDSPYVTTDTTPTRLASSPVAGGGVNTVAATVAKTVSADAGANANTSSASTGSNVSYYTSGIEGIAGLANYGRVFAGANVYVTLEQPQYITYNQNYTGSGTVGGTNGQIQFNDNGLFAGSANLTFDGANVVVGGIKTNHYYYANGSPFSTGGTPGGANTQIQFNNAGNFGGSSAFTFNRTGNVLQVTGNIVAGNVSISNLAAAHNMNATTGTFYGDIHSDGALYIGTPAGTVLGSDVVIQVTANAGQYSQTNFQNINSGGRASSDYILTADNGNDTTHYLDMGITSSGWDGSETNVLAGLVPNNGYLYVQDGNLTLGTRAGNVSHSWTFDNNAQLNLPGGTGYISSSANTITIYSDADEYNGMLFYDGGVDVYASGDFSIFANNASDSNTWRFYGDGRTQFPDNTIKTANNQPIAIRARSSGNAYSTMYQSSNSWEAYAEDDETGAHSAYAWIKADLNTLETPRVFITNAKGSDGTELTWTFDAAGNLILPNGALLKDTSGDSVAFGQNAGANNQSQHAVAIGLNAGQTNQGEDAVAIGWNAGANSQSRGIAIGWGAGYDNQGQYAQAYGKDAGSYYQQSDAVAIGDGAGRFLQKQEAIAIGYAAGYGTPQGATVASMQATNVVRIYGSTSSLYDGMTVVGGNITPGSGIFVVGLSGEDVTLSSDPPDPLTNGTNLNFYPAQSPGAIAIGSQSAQYLQGQNAVAVGYQAGQTRQGYAAVAIGEDSGQTTQGLNAISIGRSTGSNGQGNSAIAMGWNAGQDNQGNSSIAIGEDAGQSSLGAYSIAIGRLAGYASQGNNSIVLNATGIQLNTGTANSFTVAPIRASTLNDYSSDTENVLYYNTSTNEITAASPNNITGDPFAANIYDSTANVTVWIASSDQVVGAKLTVRVVYASGGWTNTEMLDITAAKNYPAGTPVFTVSNRVKTNPAYSDTLIDVNLGEGNVMQVISSAPSGAGNNVYWTVSATSFNQTFD